MTQNSSLGTRGPVPVDDVEFTTRRPSEQAEGVADRVEHHPHIVLGLVAGERGSRCHKHSARRPRGRRQQCRDATSSAARRATRATPAGRTTLRVETTAPRHPTAVAAAPRRASRPRPSNRATARRTLPALADRARRVPRPTPRMCGCAIRIPPRVDAGKSTTDDCALVEECGPFDAERRQRHAREQCRQRFVIDAAGEVGNRIDQAEHGVHGRGRFVR